MVLLFVTMDNDDDASRCVKHLNQSVLEGRYITVEKVKAICKHSAEEWPTCLFSCLLVVDVF